MKNSTVLIVVGKECRKNDLARNLEAIRAMSGRASLLVVGEAPEFPYYALGVPMYGATNIPPEWHEAVAANAAALKATAEELEELLQQHDVSGEVSTVSCEPSRVADAVARRAMLCDIAIIADELREPDTLFRQAVYGVLFQSPIGVLLNNHDPEATLAAKTVFVAWNTHLHSARAVHQALPFLRKAEEVIIATFDPVMSEHVDGEDPGADVATWLAHHGCEVTVRQYPSGGRGIGEGILERSRECGADLVVMGSYGHSRTREAFFGGTTRTLIEQTDQAVVLAH